MDRKPSVLEEAAERRALVEGVADALRNRGVVEHVLALLLAPREEAVDEGLGVLRPHGLALSAWGRGERALEIEEPADVGERFPGPLGLEGEGLEEVAPAVAPAADLHHASIDVEVVIDGMRVGDEVAAIARQHPVHGFTVVLRGVAVENVPRGGDDYPEVRALAALARLHQDARRVGAKVRGLEGILPHRVDERTRQRGELLVPATDGGARELEAFARIDALEPVQRQVVLPAAHDRVGQQARARKTARDRQLERLRRRDPRRRARGALLADELRPLDVDRDERGRAALDDLAHLLADPDEGVEAEALHLVGDELDLDARQVLGKGLAARGLAPRVGGDRLPRLALGRFLDAIAEQRGEELERELRLVGREPLGLLPEEPALELLVDLEQLEVERVVAFALFGELGVPCSECGNGSLERLDSFAQRCDGIGIHDTV